MRYTVCLNKKNWLHLKNLVVIIMIPYFFDFFVCRISQIECRMKIHNLKMIIQFYFLKEVIVSTTLLFLQ